MEFWLYFAHTFGTQLSLRIKSMKASDVLLCLSRDEQRQNGIYDRLIQCGHQPRISSLRHILERLTEAGLVVTRTTELGGCFYRLADVETVEAALEATELQD